MWTYTNGTIARNAFDCPESTTILGIDQTDGTRTVSTISAKYILTADSVPVVMHGKAAAAGFISNDGTFTPAHSVELLRTDIPAVSITSGGLDIEVPAHGIEIRTPMISGYLPVSREGVPLYRFDSAVNTGGAAILVNGTSRVHADEISFVTALSRLTAPADLILADIYTHDPASGALFLDGVSHATLSNPTQARFHTSVVLNTESPQYNDAGNWVGILFAVQAIGSVLWAVVLPMFRNRKFSYSLSLVLGGIGFVTAGYITSQYLLFVSFFLIGCAWSAMLAWPFTILTNSLKGGNIGAYLGLFNCSICIPQIVGALLGGVILSWIGEPGQLAPQHMMMVIAGISLFIGALAVTAIREHTPEAAA
ncbi:MAG: MFS transporter [Muribaculaceae bacterium]|nr:MFS transporter [Muribaculaceae bacterium]